MTSQRYVIWRISDGKAGHAGQMEGLTNALARLMDVESHKVLAPGWLGGVGWWLSGQSAAIAQLPDPQLILAAGHRTHLGALTARWARGGRVVVLMKPQLPLGWFDLCIVPEHDGVGEGRENVIVTRGVLNTMQRSHSASAERGLILLGGPSQHHGWDEQSILSQVRAVVESDGKRQWVLTTSRRTPVGLVGALEAMGLANLKVVDVQQTGPGWVARELSAASVVWVSEDSVSMVYEALTAGAAVGILEVPRKHTSRVSRGLDRLAAEGMVSRFPQWKRTGALVAAGEALAEADRCAKTIFERWFGHE